jgi:isoamylase
VDKPANLSIYPGNSDPLGFSIQGEKANFAIYSAHASKVILGIKLAGMIQEIPLERTGDVWHAALAGVTEEMEYAFRVDGPKSSRNLFNPNNWLADPYSRYPATRSKWGEGTGSVWSFCKISPPFDWQGIDRPKIPKKDLVIYEMHIRGFTRHASSQSSHPGTYLGMIEKIPYLLELGVNAVEFLPMFEFDETRTNPASENRINYWGYDPLCYFAPMRRYAAEEDPISEFKTLVRELHRNKIEIILDVVYNHTGEAGDKDYSFNFRGIDNSVYYMVDDKGNYRDYTGCKNTVNANHPAVQELILSSLRFFADEMKVDGFRFDLASILTRGEDGHVMKNPSLLQKITSDPILSNTKLIAEAWDASGLYQVGTFPDFGPWSDWNGKFRDKMRNFIKGTNGFSDKFANVFTGSQFLYGKHSPLSSINFVTAHDGFTLRDLVSYNQKHNMENGEKGQDGASHNDSWNCGQEGATDDPKVLELRERQIRNFLLALFLSQGIPMLLMGDEYGHTRRGNNNPYVQDNEINWFLWDEMEKQKEIFNFTAGVIGFRKAYSQFHYGRFLTGQDIEWHGCQPSHPDWSPQNRFVACTLKGNPSVYLAFNADFMPKTLTLPPGSWKEAARTDRPWKEHNLKDPENGSDLPATLELIPYSTLIAVAF